MDDYMGKERVTGQRQADEPIKPPIFFTLANSINMIHNMNRSDSYLASWRPDEIDHSAWNR